MNLQKAVPTRVSTESRGIAGGRRPIALCGNDLGRVGDLGVALEIAPSGAVVAAGATSRRGTGGWVGAKHDAGVAAPQPMTIDKGKVAQHRTYFPATLPAGTTRNRRGGQ